MPKAVSAEKAGLIWKWAPPHPEDGISADDDHDFQGKHKNQNKEMWMTYSLSIFFVAQTRNEIIWNIKDWSL